MTTDEQLPLDADITTNPFEVARAIVLFPRIAIACASIAEEIDTENFSSERLVQGIWRSAVPSEATKEMLLLLFVIKIDFFVFARSDKELRLIFATVETLRFLRLGEAPLIIGIINLEVEKTKMR